MMQLGARPGLTAIQAQPSRRTCYDLSISAWAQRPDGCVHI